MIEQTPADNSTPSQHESPPTPASESGTILQNAAPPARENRIVEVRRANRFLVKWRSAIVLGSAANQVTYHGWLKDISITGTAIFSDKTIPHGSLAELHIEVPATIDQKEHILTLKARIVYSLYDSSANQFRTGIEFIKFASSADQTFLSTYLNKYCHPKTVEISTSPYAS